MKKTSYKDQRAIAALLFENHFGDDLGMDDGLGMDDSMEMEDPSFGDETNVVMEIDPVAPVTPEFEEDDDLYESIKGDLKKLQEFSGRLMEVCKPNGGLEPWMIAKLAKAADYVSDVYFCLEDSVDFANTGFEQAGPEQSI